ncbi:AMP-binding protein [Paraburkholderia sp. SIMBA_055]|uniref:AMP-dependent synthetase and ligase n=1 Tax=Paraburkholderia graminis (strain ATCC 700544 / DSM 17151 / LMG 18924 / NCIMB 13744 / C4D1M) TaxID=396598 RepID=B1G827_PARG4|nr:AMP-binding protein [Paraburkholderia graminis]EDT07739.1 AMP-dependent synthetase and ligase [Paraburkholderia graminis C4D1M]CAB3653405.1 Long-chain-fatty-acid--CoA ligase [Paraburkholderia graminis C4D1M]
MSAKAYSRGLEKNPANHVPLTPLTFLDRTADVYPQRTAIIHGEFRQTWATTRERCYRLASALVQLGIEPGDTVSIIAPNTPAMLEAHFGVPLSGAVLNAINCRLDADGIAFILRHGECKLLLVDREFAALVEKALQSVPNPPRLIDINDHEAPDGAAIGETDYESLLASGDPAFAGRGPVDEWTPIALNYTSGTTGDPKGVVPSHRGTYLMSLLQMTNWPLPRAPIYLWTLPMFHANGWCFTWAITAAAGTHVCLRKVNAANILSAIQKHGVDHFCAAPIVLAGIASMPQSERQPLPRRVRVLTAGSPAPAAVLEAVGAMGFDVDHVFGITEISGTPISCAWHDEWDTLPPEQQGKLKARQGVRAAAFEKMSVADLATLEPVPADSQSCGEVLVRGNTVMMGYLKNADATEKAFAGGWFHTGDLAVVHPDGYIQITDRSKDVIISGGENISSVEVEEVIYRMSGVLNAAVVAQPDDTWGETPCAFIELKPDAAYITEQDVISFCRERLAHFKCPRRVVFGELPKTATGKIQKFRLREQAGSRIAITRLAG